MVVLRLFRLDEVSLLENLRVLELSSMGLKCLPISIGKLLLLRHLNLSFNKDLEVVPGEITKLHSLQTLLLQGCRNLRCLPNDFSKLSKLRHFDLRGCFGLTCMPLGMEKLTSLCFLPYFVVDMRNSGDTECVDELKALKTLTMIKGNIEIRIRYNNRKVERMNNTGGGYLKISGYVKKLTLDFGNFVLARHRCLYLEAALETLDPHPNLEMLSICVYHGRTIPRWGREEDNWALSFPRLVFIDLSSCSNLQEMPVLSKLPHLKTLWLCHLENLEYMEIPINDKESPIFFPSLKVLKITNLKKLKGWRKEETTGVDDGNCSKRKLIFPCLSELNIHLCQSLMSFPLCPPTLEKLYFTENNEMLEIKIKTRGDEEFESAGTSQEVFDKCASSLKILKIGRMSYLRRLSGGRGFHNFTALDFVTLGYDIYDESRYEDEHEDDDILWKSFPPSLRYMELIRLNLPKGMQYLTSLQTLKFLSCHAMEALPEWIDCLSSLQYLSIEFCSALKSFPEAMRSLFSLKTLVIRHCRQLEARCRNPTGEDWPKIRHIPDIVMQ